MAEPDGSDTCPRGDASRPHRRVLPLYFEGDCEGYSVGSGERLEVEFAGFGLIKFALSPEIAD